MKTKNSAESPFRSWKSTNLTDLWDLSESGELVRVLGLAQRRPIDFGLLGDNSPKRPSGWSSLKIQVRF